MPYLQGDIFDLSDDLRTSGKESDGFRREVANAILLFVSGVHSQLEQEVFAEYSTDSRTDGVSSIRR